MNELNESKSKEETTNFLLNEDIKITFQTFNEYIVLMICVTRIYNHATDIDRLMTIPATDKQTQNKD